MPGNLLHVNATITCPHGGQARPIPAQSRVLVSGQPVDSLADAYTVTGCPFTVASKPQPCVTVRWTSPATRIQVAGSPALLQGSVGICLSADQVPQGTALVSVVQQRAVGQ